MAGQQLSLFDDRAAALLAWQAKFERADWVAPYDCQAGSRGTVVRGWRCPACGQVEINAHIMQINHGLDPDRPQAGELECARVLVREYRAAVGLPPLQPLDQPVRRTARTSK